MMFSITGLYHDTGRVSRNGLYICYCFGYIYILLCTLHLHVSDINTPRLGCRTGWNQIGFCEVRFSAKIIRLDDRYYRPTFPSLVSVLGFAVTACTDTMASLILVCSSL